MQFNIPLNREEFVLGVTVRTKSPQNIRFILKDANQARTVLTNRWTEVNGTKTIYINVPLCDMDGTLIIYNDDIGNIPAKSDVTFDVVKIFRLPLEKRYDVVDFNNKALMSYVTFCQRFCYNCGVLDSGTYVSEDGKYVIQYLPTITENGVEQTTCARICKDDGHIQVSMAKFDSMTVPMRIVILLHEYSHYYINSDIDNETEADINALAIYLGLGYPRIEASDAFTESFLGAPYEANGKRYAIIHKFIQEFDSSKILVTS